MELYRKHRPRKLEAVIGQPAAVAQLARFLKRANVPHALLYTGPSGCGKTTLARIVARAVGTKSKRDLKELNCADFRGVDMVRDIRSKVNLQGFSGGARTWIIDEAHMLTKDAQNAFLKLLEDPPTHAYFALATTDPSKLLPTVRNRTTVITVRSIPHAALEAHVKSVAKAEGTKLSSEVLEQIATVADGSARKALVLLEQVIGLDDEEQQLAAIEAGDVAKASIDLCRALIDPRAQWPNVAKLLKSIDEEPEKVRRAVLGYATSVLLGCGKLAPRAALVISAFGDNVYDSGRGGLANAAYEVCRSK